MKISDVLQHTIVKAYFKNLKLNIMSEELENEIIDLEEYSKSNRKPPHKRRYRIKVDRQKYVVNQECLTGKEILQLAGKTPPEQFQLRQKVRGGQVIKIGLEDKVDLTKPGIEKFMTIPLDQTEG